MMKKIMTIATGFIAYFMVILIIDGYENIRMHTSINDAIVDWFWYRSPTNYLANNTLIKFSEETIEGPKVVQGGKMSVNESSAKMTPKEWINHGGFSADEPQLPASLRHFYDPVKIDGVSYLTDLVEGIALEFGYQLPKMDAKEWALTANDNFYNWKTAKSLLRAAFSEGDATRRSELLAKAYRSLGETLHLFADMGCPPHVRNDAHPAFISGKVGDPDPYEELIKTTQVLDYGTSALSPDQITATQFKSALTAANLFETMAQFTNKNFFSEDTQYGTNITPHISDRPPYTSPAVGSDVLYNSSDKYYYKTINGKQIKMLVSNSYFFANKLTIDLACVKSQASVLIPTIVEGGANLIKLFIPKITVEITDAKDDGSFSGLVKHKLDSEFTIEFKYNGKIKILKGTTLIGEVTSTNNSISGSGLNIKKDDKITAQLEIGGMIFTSNEFTVKEKTTTISCWDKLLLSNAVDVSLVFDATYSDGTSKTDYYKGFPTGDRPTGNWFNGATFVWTGNNFVREKTLVTPTSVSVDTLYCRMEGSISIDGNTMESFKAIWTEHYVMDGTWYNSVNKEETIGVYAFELKNIPLTRCDEYFRDFIVEGSANMNNYLTSSGSYHYSTETRGTITAPDFKVIENKQMNTFNLKSVKIRFW